MDKAKFNEFIEKEAGFLEGVSAFGKQSFQREMSIEAATVLNSFIIFTVMTPDETTARTNAVSAAQLCQALMEAVGFKQVDVGDGGSFADSTADMLIDVWKESHPNGKLDTNFDQSVVVRKHLNKTIDLIRQRGR